MNDQELATKLFGGEEDIVCPDCGGTEFFAGPQGGFSENVKCKKCGAEFNVIPPCVVCPAGFAERI